MKLGSLFTGYGGLEMAAGPHFDAETVWCSDIDPGACRIIAHRFPDVPNLGDITRVDWTQVEPVDVLTGGWPCQDLSHAGKRLGLKPGTRSGLWTHMAYAISQLRPRYVVAENVRGLLSARADSDLEPCPWCVGGAADGEPDLRALGAVLGDLAGLGYDTRWVGLRAADVGAPHGRFRIFILAADTERLGWDGWPHESVRGASAPADTQRGRWDGWTRQLRQGRRAQPADGGETPTDPDQPRLEGRPGELDRGPEQTPGPRGLDTPADAERLGFAGRGGVRDVGGAAEDRSREAQQRQRDRDAAHDRVQRDPYRCGGADIAWGVYEPAVRRWESILGRLAPAPTEPGPKGGQRLSPKFVEWMQGVPEGWVTDVPRLSRNAQLKALGNGVVPQQAAAALRILTDMEAAA